MTTESNEDFDTMMLELRKEYLESLPEKLSHLESLLAQTDHESLTNEFHKLKGTGKTYGIPEVTELGALAEQLCANKKQDALEFIPQVIDLFKAIVTTRNGNQEFSLSGNDKFTSLKKLL